MNKTTEDTSSQAGAGPLEPSVRPCPFCGSANGSEEQGETYRWIRWRCADCAAIGPEVRCNITAASSRGGRDEREARKLALNAWNERTGPNIDARQPRGGPLQRRVRPVAEARK